MTTPVFLRNTEEGRIVRDVKIIGKGEDWPCAKLRTGNRMHEGP